MMKKKITEYKHTCLKRKLHPSQKKTITSCWLASTHSMIGLNEANWQCIMLYVQGQHRLKQHGTKSQNETHARQVCALSCIFVSCSFFPLYCIPITCSTRNVGFLQHGCQSSYGWKTGAPVQQARL